MGERNNKLPQVYHIQLQLSNIRARGQTAQNVFAHTNFCVRHMPTGFMQQNALMQLKMLDLCVLCVTS